jgi:protein-L-isoaspartate(D-aspartate) O-methyltransferase
MNKNKTILEKFWAERFLFSPSEMIAFEEIKREDFVPPMLRQVAYDDIPLPILRGKTISQPTTVMLMTSALELEEGNKVLEVGSGSGYQAALIGKIVGRKGKVVSMEVIPELVQYARSNLRHARISNVEVHEGDGSRGFPSEAPFDRIILTAACREFPKPLIDQLKVDGIILGPVGNKQEQELVKGVKDKEGRLSFEFLGQFLFSPMSGKYGFEE